MLNLDMELVALGLAAGVGARPAFGLRAQAGAAEWD